MKQLLILLFLSISFISQAQKFKKNEFSIGHSGGYFFDHKELGWADWKAYRSWTPVWFKFPRLDFTYTRWVNPKWSVSVSHINYSTYFYKNNIVFPVNPPNGYISAEGAIEFREFKRIYSSINYNLPITKHFMLRSFAGVNWTYRGYIVAFEGISFGAWDEAFLVGRLYQKPGIQTGLTLRHTIFKSLYAELSTQYVRMAAVYFLRPEATLKGRLDSNQLFFSYNLGIRF